MVTYQVVIFSEELMEGSRDEEIVHILEQGVDGDVGRLDYYGAELEGSSECYITGDLEGETEPAYPPEEVLDEWEVDDDVREIIDQYHSKGRQREGYIRCRDVYTLFYDLGLRREEFVPFTRYCTGELAELREVYSFLEVLGLEREGFVGSFKLDEEGSDFQEGVNSE